MYLKVFVDQKLITLTEVDNHFKKINIRLCDGDKPSPLAGVSLHYANANLRQHGNMLCTLCCY